MPRQRDAFHDPPPFSVGAHRFGCVGRDARGWNLPFARLSFADTPQNEPYMPIRGTGATAYLRFSSAEAFSAGT